MRSFIVVLLLALAGCGGSSTSVPAPSNFVTTDQMNQAIAEAVKTQAASDASQVSAVEAKLSKVQLMAGVTPAISDNATRATYDLAFRSTLNAISFGPCSDAGIKIGATVAPGGSALDEQTQAFKQTPTQTCPGVYAEYDVASGNLHTAGRVYFTSPDCSGNPLVWDSGGQGYDPQKLPAGLSFISPVDGQQYWVSPGTNSVITQVQSAYIVINGACGPDADQQPMWEAVRTTTNESGVALTLGPAFQLNGL